MTSGSLNDDSKRKRIDTSDFMEGLDDLFSPGHAESGTVKKYKPHAQKGVNDAKDNCHGQHSYAFLATPYVAFWKTNSTHATSFAQILERFRNHLGSTQFYKKLTSYIIDFLDTAYTIAAFFSDTASADIHFFFLPATDSMSSSMSVMWLHFVMWLSGVAS